jgi:hypothetical protein
MTYLFNQDASSRSITLDQLKHLSQFGDLLLNIEKEWNYNELYRVEPLITKFTKAAGTNNVNEQDNPHPLMIVVSHSFPDTYTITYWTT